MMTDVVKVITLLYCYTMLGCRREELSKYKAASGLLICASAISNRVFYREEIAAFFVQMFILMLYVFRCFKKKRLYRFLSFSMLYIGLEFVNFLIAAISFLAAVVMDIELYTMESEIMSTLFCVLAYIGVILIFRCRGRIDLGDISMTAKIGMFFILMIAETMFLVIRNVEYDSRNTMFYMGAFCAIVFSAIVFLLWIIDKKQEQKKIRELSAYAHRIREVIPSMNRILERMDDMSVLHEQAGEIINELRMICSSDIERTRKEAAGMKTFDTTESLVLDAQLQRYLEEAAEQRICLDIMVRGTVKDILNERKIELYSLLQVIGDLYRNANQAVLMRERNRRILICFGYNMDGYYEVSVHDNGELFAEYVLEHLGERGVTTGGTGHGIADIFEVLEKNQISFVLNQDTKREDIFTKSVCIVFDGRGEKIIKCR